MLNAFVCWAVGNPKWAWEWTSGCGISLQSGFFQVREDSSARGNREENHFEYLTLLFRVVCLWKWNFGIYPLCSPSLKKCWWDGSRCSWCSAEKGAWRAVLAQALLWHPQDYSVIEKLFDGRYWLSEAFYLPDLSSCLVACPLASPTWFLGCFILELCRRCIFLLRNDSSSWWLRVCLFPGQSHPFHLPV